jgi:opacity protein-like surface antigen
MKKLLFTLAVLSFVTFSARNADAQQLMIGGRVGLNIGNASFSPSLESGISTSANTGLLIGGQLDNWFNDMWAISVQLLYVQKGVGLSASGNGETISVSDAVNYIEIPILAKVAFGSGAIKPYLFAGPSIGIMVSASTTENGTSTSDDSDFNSIDLAALVGAGVSFKIDGGPSIFVDAGYAIGLINIASNNSDNTVSPGVQQTIKTNDIRIAAGVMFPLN